MTGRDFRRLCAMMLAMLMFFGALPLNALAQKVTYATFTLNVEPTDGADDVSVTFMVDDAEFMVYTVKNGGLIKTEDDRYAFRGIPNDPTPPSKEESFKGWYLNQSDDNPFDFDKTIEDSLTLTAKFADIYLISFKDMPGFEGKVVSTIKLEPGKPISLPYEAKQAADEMAPENLRVIYWYAEDDFGEAAFDFRTERAKEDVTLVPMYGNLHYVVFISARSKSVV